jgi:hypothetical protein
MDSLVKVDGDIIVILCRRNAGHRLAKEGKREVANCSNFRPYDGGIIYLEENVHCRCEKKTKILQKKRTDSNILTDFLVFLSF